MKLFMFRYCWMIARPPLYLLAAFGLVGALAARTLFRGHEDPSVLLVVTLFLQAFAASNGFRRAALRGQFDLLLLRGSSRSLLALAHWSAAAVPGIATWVLVGAFLRVGTGSDVGFSTRGALALAAASTIPWAMTVPLPPLTGGVVTVLTLVVLGANRWGLDLLRAALIGQDLILGPWERLQYTVLFAICPLLLLGESQAALDPIVQGIDAAFVATAVIGAMLYIAKRDYPLAPTL